MPLEMISSIMEQPTAVNSALKFNSTPSFQDYLVVLKVNWDTIQIGPKDEMKTLIKTHSIKIFCHQLNKANNNLEDSTKIKVFVFNNNQDDADDNNDQYDHNDEINTDTSSSQFVPQEAPYGQEICEGNIVNFMTDPYKSEQSANYALILSCTRRVFNARDEITNSDTRKLGTAYLSLEPKFSSQGCQTMKLIGTYTNVPIGHIQAEYLIVRNPLAYNVRVPRPSWLTNMLQLDAGHRGSGSGCRPDLSDIITENTVASFNYAARHGADMCELDVMCTADGIPVVFHNYVVETGNPNLNQVEQMTLEQLRGLTEFRLHDKDCKHNNKLMKKAGELKETTQNKDLTTTTASNNVLKKNLSFTNSTRMFPTLEEVLKNVDKSCALNIELKSPQLLSNGQSEAKQYREINDNVDRILNCIYEHANGRAILLSTFHPDLAILLRLKQAIYPVLFITTGDSTRFNDPVTKTVKNAIHFAQAFDLAGINPNAAKVTGNLVKYAQERGQLVYAWGKIDTSEAVRDLRRTGLNGVIYDKIDLIKPKKEN